VRLQRIQGDDIAASTGSGEADLEAVSGRKVQAQSGSGNVRVSLARGFSGDLRTETQSGNIGLKLPADANCRIEATAGSGGVSNSLPLHDLSSAHGHLTGRLGAGLGQIELRTGSGNITLEPASSG
jgi:DUF4097 and DUF4098 domain-containing protein YvlB